MDVVRKKGVVAVSVLRKAAEALAADRGALSKATHPVVHPVVRRLMPLSSG